jgi:uncharacterized peroxidase-related enzyme
MTRLKAVNPLQATGKTKELFNAIQGKLGMVPNMMKTFGNSSAALEAYLNFSGALSHGLLDAKTGELIALAVAESNACNYCLSAHSYIGAKLVKIDAQALTDARNGISADPKTDALLKFAKVVVNKRGSVTDADVSLVKSAGATEGEITEVITHVALNILTNYFNKAANTDVDFPLVEANSVQFA